MNRQATSTDDQMAQACADAFKPLADAAEAVMKPKWTSGDWVAYKGAGWCISRPEGAANRECALMVGMSASHSIVTSPHHYDDEAESEANAKLMAAAPKLYRALEKTVKCIEACPDLRPHLRGHLALMKLAMAAARGD